jgi:hypothetical protein
VRHWFYPFNQASYRVKGPHSMYEAALHELMSDKPSSFTKAAPVLYFMWLSMLPHRLHPNAISIGSVLANAGGFTAPKGSRLPRDHFLGPDGRRNRRHHATHGFNGVEDPRSRGGADASADGERRLGQTLM